MAHLSPATETRKGKPAQQHISWEPRLGGTLTPSLHERHTQRSLLAVQFQQYSDKARGLCGFLQSLSRGPRRGRLRLGVSLDSRDLTGPGSHCASCHRFIMTTKPHQREASPQDTSTTHAEVKCLPSRVCSPCEPPGPPRHRAARGATSEALSSQPLPCP